MRTLKTRPCDKCGGKGELENPIYRGREMRRLRQEAGLGLREVARKMGFSAAYVSDLELGRRGWNETLIRAYRFAIGRVGDVFQAEEVSEAGLMGESGLNRHLTQETRH